MIFKIQIKCVEKSSMTLKKIYITLCDIPGMSI